MASARRPYGKRFSVRMLSPALLPSADNKSPPRLMSQSWSSLHLTGLGSGICRRITLPLDGSSSEVKVENLMRDDASYTSTDMPRVNPGVKVSHACRTS